MSRLLIAFLLLASVQDDGSKPIFDGKTLAGWVSRGGGKWSVDDGCILGETGSGAYGWLCTEKKYGDFEFQMEMKVEGLGNSGVQARSAIDDKDLMVGYQFDIDRTRPSSGRLYDEARRLLLMDVPQDPAARTALKAEEWNTFKISCVADHLHSWVNGVPIVDYVDSVDVDGIIALQVHSGKVPVRIRFRNVRIKDLGHRKWKPIFDGKTLGGWDKKGSGWSVEDGVLAGRGSKTEASTLSVALPTGDFTVRLRYKANGLNFAGLGDGSWGLTPRAEVQPKPHIAGEWNSMTVSARRDRIVVQVNDLKVSDTTDAGKRSGKLVLNLPAGADSAVLIKDLERLGDPE